MATLAELRLVDRLFVHRYPWRTIDTVPWTPLANPLAPCRLALVSSAGFVLPDQAPFDARIRGGDSSFREIPSTTDVRDLRDAHRSHAFDHSGLLRDPNVAFPLDRACELAARGRVGSVSRRHISFVGSITMTVRVVRLGSERVSGEGLRIGTVRRPPRGVPKSEHASGNWYDVWFPNLAPSPETMKLGQAADTPARWAAFVRKYRAEMATPDTSRILELLAALSRTSDFSVGCYCEHEARCHRSVLGDLLIEKGAAGGLAPPACPEDSILGPARARSVSLAEKHERSPSTR